MEELTLVQGDGVVTVKADKGRCLNRDGRTYASVTHVSIDTADKCKELLQLLGQIKGVEGAQLGSNSKCEILFDVNKDTSKALKHQQVVLGARMWEAEDL